MQTLGFVAFTCFLALGCGSNDESSPPAGTSGGSAGAGGTLTGGAGGTAGQAGGSGGVPIEACPEGAAMGDVAGKPLIDVMFGDKGPYKFVYDTGAPSSGMDTALYDEVGAGPYTLGIAGQTVDVPVIQTVPTAAVGIPGVSGIIGGDVMKGFAVTLDFSRKRFWLEPIRDESALLGCAHVSGAPVEVTWIQQSYLFVPGKMDSAEGWFLVDSGASLGAVPETIFSQIDAAAPRPALEGFYTPAAIGTFWSLLSTAGRMEVAGHAVEHLALRTVDDGVIPVGSAVPGPFLGVLPTDYLKHFLVTVDYPAGALRLDPYTGLDSKEPTRFFTVGIGLESKTDLPIHVAQVLEGSAAADAGVQEGDEVTSIQGHPLATLTPYQRPFALVSDKNGANISVTVLRDGTEIEVDLETRDLLVSPAP
jgi:hypothetical protein